MKKVKAIITGSTGMVGKSVLLECLKNPNVESVLIINRHSVGFDHIKMKEIILKDFFNISSIKDKLSGYNACFYCMGISSSEVSKEDYRKITYDVTMLFAETISALNDEMTFCYVSGVGTDSKEKSRMHWANIKGKTENDLLSMSFTGKYMIRLGMLYPAKGIKSKTKSFNFLYTILRPILYLFKMIFPKGIVSSENFGKAMINSVLFGYEKKYLWNKDLNILALL